MTTKIGLVYRGLIVLVFLCVASAAGIGAEKWDPYPVADPVYEGGAIIFQPKVEYKLLVLRVTGPDGSVFYKEFDSGSSPVFEVGPDVNGRYTYELFVIPEGSGSGRELPDDGVKMGREPDLFGKALQQSYSFTAVNGAIIFPDGPGEGDRDPDRVKDILHYDDVIITGSLCVGFDCQNGESFGYDTIILKEHNLRIYFNDTSYAASYPTDNWRITINDSTNGGAGFFSIDDADENRSIFKVESGAPANSLYVEDYGRVGLGTSTPVVELHIKDSDTPSVRLEQDSSGGWSPQTWDVAGNESNFFIRDATNGSRLPFRIQPSTPSSTLCLKSTGKVGIGTWSPDYALEVETTGENAQIVAQRTSGAQAILSATSTYAYIGAVSDNSLRFTANNSWVMQLNKSGSATLLDMVDGGDYDGTWNDASSREFKENIRGLDNDEAMRAFTALSPVKYNYKTQKDENRVGFIAEDVPDLVARNGRKNLSSMDIVAVLTKVMQQQQEALQRQQETIEELKKEIENIKKDQ